MISDSEKSEKLLCKDPITIPIKDKETLHYTITDIDNGVTVTPPAFDVDYKNIGDVKYAIFTRTSDMATCKQQYIVKGKFCGQLNL